MIERMNQQAFEPVDLSRATKEQIAMVSACFAADDAPEVWREMAELNFVALRAAPGLESQTDEALALLAVNLVHQMVSSFGGTQPYIPCGKKFHQLAKAARIVSEFNGRNIRQLAKKHRYSETRIRHIVGGNA